MANYATLKDAIQDVIKTNGNNEITGALLQQSLLAIINSLGAGYQFIGIATPETNPGTHDQKVFYIGASGTYPNFGPAVIPDGNLGVFYYDSSWHYGTVSFPIGNNSVTEAKLASALVGKLFQTGYKYMGVATTSTNPGTPDQNVFYIATTAGTYTNFGSLTVNSGECAILKYNNGWTKDTTNIATDDDINELLGYIGSLNFTINGKITESLSGAVRTYGINKFNLIQNRKYTLKVTLTSAVSSALYVGIRKNGSDVHTWTISAGTTSLNSSFVESVGYDDCQITVYCSVQYAVSIELTGESLVDILSAYDNIEPGNMLSLTSNVVGKALFELFNLPYQKLTGSNTNNWALLGSGLSVSNSSARLVKYQVTPGKYLFLNLSKDTAGVYQFQTSSSVPSSGVNANLLNKTITNAAYGVVLVPPNATYLIVSQLQSNTTNFVAEITSLSADIIAQVMGRTIINLDFGTGSVAQYTVRTYAYPIVTGHTYNVEIETTDTTDTTYFSTRSDATHTVQSDLGTGSGSRTFQFKATGDAPLVALSYKTAGTGAIHTIKITDMDSVTTYGNYYQIQSLEARVGGGIVMPDYAKAEQIRLYNLLTARSQSAVHIAAFNTDQHINIDNDTPNSGYNPKWVMQGVQALINIANLLPLDEIVFGGDAPGYGGAGTSYDADGILQTINYLLEPTHDVNAAVVSVPGNHDAYQNNGSVTAQGMYNVHAKRNQRHLYYHGNGIDNSDAYIDDTEHKIRSIYLDTCSTNVRTESFRDFLTSALSTLPDGYMALIFSHFPLTNEFAGTILAQKISDPTVQIDAFQDPADCHTILNQYAEKIIACINGHTHFDAFGISSAGILYIETTTAAPHTRNYTTENIPNTSTLGTVTDTSFDFFIINQADKTIEALRYGQGCNRKWVYKGANIGQVAGYPQTIVRS